eukprot:scaffold136511_cov35-Tisochrysis_lutea.AAC.1
MQCSGTLAVVVEEVEGLPNLRPLRLGELEPHREGRERGWGKRVGRSAGPLSACCGGSATTGT